jgi:hypothetical protein
MPFCPSCEQEYRPDVSVCPGCNVSLVAELDAPRRGSNDDTVDVFVCYDSQLVERVSELLRDAGVGALVRDRTSTAFPTTVGTSGERRIAVPSPQVGAAAAALERAVGDGVITRDEGEILVAVA